MKIPKTLKIGAHIFKVKVDYTDLTTDSGCMDVNKGLISLDGSLPETHLGQSLFHEILHAMNSELDHELLESLSQQLFQVFYDNADIKWKK